MEKNKKWEDFTSEEKTNLLNHWFHYYGGVLMTLKDIELFDELSKIKQDAIFNHIVTLYIYKKTIQSNMLISFMRENKLADLFSANLVRPMLSNEEALEFYEEVRDIISNEIYKTYLKPEPSVPMDVEITVEEPKKK